MKRYAFILLFLACAVVKLHAVGWTPTDAGFVLNFEEGDQFLLSVWIDLNGNGTEDAGEEFFVCDYPSYNGGRFNYEAKDYLKLVPQAPGATTPSAASIWTVGNKLTHSTRVNGEDPNFTLDGICYTMWGNGGNSLMAAESPTKSSTFKILGWLTNNTGHGDLCDVAMVVPSDNTRTKSMDPNNTLGRASATGKFNGQMGTGFAGMTYREVYWFAIPRNNGPISYTNAAVMTFNTTSSNKSWSAGTIKPGFAAYAFADTKHNPTTRTVFRIYPLNKPFTSCNSYFFGWDVQDYTRYRNNTNTGAVSYTNYRKIYTLDHFECMERLEDRQYYQTAGMNVPSSDSTYFYVGYHNTFYPTGGLGANNSKSAFKRIDSLRIRPLRHETTVFKPSKNAYGFIAIDTTSSRPNLWATFEPAGYFFHTNSGRNVEMRRVDDFTWITNEMWTITEAYMGLQGEVLLYTGSAFSESDPGAKIDGWSEMQAATDIPVYGHPGWTAKDHSGWARVHINSPEQNGAIEFVLAETSRELVYDYNGLIGTAIPNAYPMEGKTKVKVEDARLKEGFTFLGWATSPGGDVVYWPAGTEGKEHHIGDSIVLPVGTTTLYAKGTFNDTYRVAFSFIHPTNGKRYWMTHPNTSAPRFARARTFTDWTNVYQGMSDAENSEPNYVSTYKMIGNPTCALCTSDEYVLDPRHETVHGVVDSLTFYERWSPANEEYLGLYYTTPNTILANNTWAGAFKSTEGWPAYNRTAVDNTKLSSEHYFTGMKTGEYAVNNRPRLDYVKYDATTNQFDGVAEEANGTAFQITGIAVADAHYVILPDTIDSETPWRNEVTFDYHNEVQHEQVWSKVIGKQLMACLRVGPDTVYFHPNDRKTITNANELRLSNDYRLTHAFELIRDSRFAAGVIAEGDSVTMEETSTAFSCNIHSGASSPIGLTEDIVDTLRVWLRPSGTSKIKAYYGRWKKGASGLHIQADGSRYRDILIKTKTYHYGAEQIRVVLKPVLDVYNFGPLADLSQTLTFRVIKEHTRPLLDASGAMVSTEVLGRDTVTDVLNLTGATCTLKEGATYFTIGTKTATGITLTTKVENPSGENNDTLTVSTSVTIDAVTYPVTAKVPLVQTDLTGSDLIWSVEKDGKRYYIMAGSGGLIFREYTLRGNTLYKQNTWTQLVKGTADAANTDIKYITPWAFDYNPSDASQLTLKTVLPGEPEITKYFDPTSGGVGGGASYMNFVYVDIHTNDNGNIEEKVKLKYGDSPSQWLKFEVSGSPATPRITTTTEEADASVFSWGYLSQEYNLLNNGAYPSANELVYGYNNGAGKSVQTRYKAYRIYSMLVNNTLTYLCKEEETNIANLIDVEKDWKTRYVITRIADGRTFDAAASSGFGAPSVNASNLVTTITPGSATSPTNVAIAGKYVDIVDTLQVTLSLQGGAPAYRFNDWEGVSSISDACLKIPLVRKTYHSASYDSVYCVMEKDEYNFAFPSSLRKDHSEDSLKTFHFETLRLKGTNMLDVDNKVVAHSLTDKDTVTVSGGMDLSSTALAEVRLVDEYGNEPDWCEIVEKGAKTITVRCKSNGVRTPRSAYIYFAYIVTIDAQYKYVNFKLTVSQASLFQYANNQTLIHMPGASGDPLMADGRQCAHENKRIFYYYNPKPYAEKDQNVELPIRERGYYGWWRWYQENKGVEDTDIPDSVWITPPRNVGKYNFPFRIIGDSVMLKKKDGTDSVKVLVTMGRYTVFHYPSKGYSTKVDPPAKAPYVKAPWNKDTVTYVVDISNYYDHLPLSMSQVNQIDTAVLDTMKNIPEPTLSLREVYELHPWTEMAEKLEGFKDTIASSYRNQKYLEDHEVMAPIGNRLLLSTEQRYNYDNLEAKGHSESLLGYYMRDDNYGTWAGDKDTMIWCGGWDVDCEWYTYNPSSKTYTPCTHPITVEDDFLDVPAKRGITAGQDYDTVYYCLRAHSKATTIGGTPAVETTADGAYWFNICRYVVIYHDPRKYGPIEEKGRGGVTKALITNDEIEQNYEVLERLNFDYVKPGRAYHIYPHPLPWADGSYGYTYPVTSDVPTNRYHDEKDFPGPGEYALINRIPYSTYWRKLEQHGDAENGYMIYCDGMSSAGQVAALSLETQLCEGQKMYFSGYVGNVSNQVGKSNPNFTISVQGSNNGTTWNDITSYMTGDIQPSDKWYQIFFPINQEGEYDKFRIRIYNEASNFDGNDFVIDDICVFATKPPLIAYQANTRCVDDVKSDSITNVVLRVDYQGFVDHSFNNTNVYYTVEKTTKAGVNSFVPMIDHYLNESIVSGTPDTIFGYIPMPGQTYVPTDEDSIFINLQDLVKKFGDTESVFKKGYLYESLDGEARPVLYVVHQAKMTADNSYKVRMAVAEKGKGVESAYRGLMSSKCAVTSNLKITNRMVLELNGEEVEENNMGDICANSTYDLAMSIKGSLFIDSVAPLDVKGSCINDWLLYGDTADATSVVRYGYKYSDIKKLIVDVLRNEDEYNTNLKATNLAAVNRNIMQKMQTDHEVTFTTPGHTGDHPYDILTNLVNNGFLTLYKRNLTATVSGNDSVQYVIFPIHGTGTTEMNDKGMEVCTTPIFVKLKPTRASAVPLIVGGIKRDSTEMSQPVAVLVNARTANDQVALRIDSIMANVAIHSISLLSTDDPDFYEGVNLLNLEPDRIYSFGGDNSGYYKKGNDILLRPASSNNYTMRQGYKYTFGIVMQGLTGSLDDGYGCPIGTVPVTLSIVPDYLRWAPQSKDNNKWNDPNNWIAVDDHNDTLIVGSRFAPIASTDIIIPPVTDGMPYPNIPAPSAITHADSIREVNFVYNTCDDIRFLAGAAIGQQQRLTCDAVVADMTMPNGTWALRSAPITGMLSGDIYMSDADLSGETRPWYVSEFDTEGRNHATGNASFWLSLYNNTTVTINAKTDNDTITSDKAEWSKVTNGLTLSLPPAQGFAVYSRTKSGDAADVRLPKNDDVYYYYGTYGERLDYLYEDNLRTLRATNAGVGGAGKLAFYPGLAADHQDYTLSNTVASKSFVFGNPTMGYIDIWGFIADNTSLKEEIAYMDDDGYHTPVTKASAEAGGKTDTITDPTRYLPPMRAMVINFKDAVAATASLNLTLNANRIVTHPSQKAARPSAPRHLAPSGLSKGIMTVTAVNPVSNRCVSRLLIGQGYNEAIISGEDAVLTTLNIDKFHMTNTPTTPFNIYAMEGAYGLSIDLLDSIVNIPVSFYMSNLPYASVTHLWFTGVNRIDGPLVFYDALLDIEQPIVDGIRIDIQTPEQSHEVRYYIRRRGYKAPTGTDVATGFETEQPETERVVKFIKNDHVYILRHGEVYTVMGQRVQ